MQWKEAKLDIICFIVMQVKRQKISWNRWYCSGEKNEIETS